MDHIAKVSYFCMEQQSTPCLDVTRPDPQFGINEEQDACRVGPYLLHLLVGTSPMVDFGCCRFDL